jgi:hypothetical protein
LDDCLGWEEKERMRRRKGKEEYNNTNITPARNT